MFDIGWSEMVVIGVVALIAIGPKELPGVLRSVGQWVGKARRLAADFQGQFQEAIREAELADVKKQFDEMSAATSQIASGTTVFDAAKQDVEKALMLDPVGTPTTPEPPTVETFREETVHEAMTQGSSPAAAVEPLAIAPQAPDKPAS
jgi:sec-independent protein translocase protein TatB